MQGKYSTAELYCSSHGAYLWDWWKGRFIIYTVRLCAIISPLFIFTSTLIVTFSKVCGRHSTFINNNGNLRSRDSDDSKKLASTWIARVNHHSPSSLPSSKQNQKYGKLPTIVERAQHCLLLGILVRNEYSGNFLVRYDTRCYFNVRSKADISQLNLPHGTDN